MARCSRDDLSSEVDEAQLCNVLTGSINLGSALSPRDFTRRHSLTGQRDSRHHNHDQMSPPVTRSQAACNEVKVTFENDGSDYGSDLDEGDIISALETAESQQISQSFVLESIEEHNLPRAAYVPLSPNTALRTLFRPRRKILIDDDGVAFEVPDNHAPLREASVEVEYHESNRTAFQPVSREDDRQHRSVSVPAPEDLAADKSPIERFRTPPKKPLSVTDIVSPAWCELQYFYNLSKFGKVQKTPAMRQGSSVHKVLEEQVHVAVPIEVTTREDSFGLRIWNIIQGLRTLRINGMTREMEIWGVVEDQVVNGVIDELSYSSPDTDLEQRLAQKMKPGRLRKSDTKPEDQMTIDTFVSGAKTLGDTELASSYHRISVGALRKVYLTDVKTRNSSRLPQDEPTLRPTFMQLMLYRHMLGQLASGNVPPTKVLERYRINGDQNFSDTFIAQIGGPDYSFHPAIDSTSSFPPTSSIPDPIDELVANCTPLKLWSVMVGEFRKTIVSPDKSISSILQAEYRAPFTGDIMGRKIFVSDEKRLQRYLRDEMAWWKGERPARGVDIEEAFKCKICVFADGCTWRKVKVDEAIQKARLRAEDSRRKSEV